MTSSKPHSLLPPLIYITGASSGIGRAIAYRYARSGWRVALVARRTAQLQQWCEEELALAAGSYAVYGADVRNVTAITDAGRQCITEMGLPDVVIAAAGISVGVDTAELEDTEVMRRVYETNNIGMMATFQPFVAPMKTRGSGTLVGIASVAGIRGLAGHGAYCSSKAAVISYCESLRLEMREATGVHGVRVVTILPGYVATPLTAQNRYAMPFLLDSDEFARRAIRVITKQVSYAVIPWQMGLVAKLMRLLPNWLFDRLFTGRERKQRENEFK